MPEGDTIYRAAAMMHRALAGRAVRAFESPLPALSGFAERRGLIGRLVERVEARGKYLLVRFSDGLTLLTHLRMNGSWHLYRPGERWRRPRSHMRARLVTDEWEAVGFGLPIAEFHDDRSLARSERLRTLGPDPLAASFDAREAAEALRGAEDLPIEEALLDQRRIAGIGNVLKSEALFLAGTYPYAAAGSVPTEKLLEIVEACRRLLRDNVAGVERPAIARRSIGRNTTRAANPAARLYVYGRAGQPCRRCGSIVRVKRAGAHARSTYWCSECQKSATDNRDTG
ncbi:MAG TPA: DNA-formamidopyrimidine glycosylase family protein [Vicinamibacterales bacterium]|nr:DNA-formamidopyrimidine glycosylase family protein [Vicinamibacterales bacterium]